MRLSNSRKFVLEWKKETQALFHPWPGSRECKKDFAFFETSKRKTPSLPETQGHLSAGRNFSGAIHMRP